MWLRRHWQIALCGGLGLGALGQLLVAWLAASDVDSSAWQRVAAVFCSTAALAGVALALGLLSARWLARPAGRIAATALSSAALGLCAFVLVFGVACRIVSGSYLTAGAVAFTLNSREHFLHAATGTYLRVLIWGLLALALFSAACALVLRRAARPLVRSPRREIAALVSLSLALGVVYARRDHSRFLRGMFAGAPLLALVSSLTPDFELSRASALSAAVAEPLAPPGPPRAQEAVWRAQVEAARRGPSSKPPNVLLFILESIAQSHLGLYGYPRPTPEIDRLASEGLLMTRAWTTATHSNYAQPAILSSLFPRRGHGLDEYERLDYPRFLFHDAMHALGYDTATISSQDEDWQGMRRFQDTGTPTFYWYADDYPGPGLDSGVERIAPDEATADEALDWLARPRQGPFALYVNFQATHFPYTLVPGTPRPYRPDEPNWPTFTYLRYPRADRDAVINRYDNALAYVDRQIGRIRRYLEHSGQLDDTLIIVTADHGEMFFDRGMVTHGKSLYEVEARVPIILRWPGHVPVERRDEPVSHLDILPTLFDRLGLPPHPSWQGESFLSPRPPSAGKRAIFMNIQGLRFADAVVCWPYKLIIDRTAKEPHLYRLDRDPDEQHDLIDSEPAIAERLDTTLGDQLIAQLDYHRKDALPLRQERFAPRLRRCPALDR